MMTCSPVDPLPAPVIESAPHRAGVASKGHVKKSVLAVILSTDLAGKSDIQISLTPRPKAPRISNEALNGKYHALS
jgi:hypothetical protein